MAFADRLVVALNEDDRAIFVEDTLSHEAARRIATTESGMAMLSPFGGKKEQQEESSSASSHAFELFGSSHPEAKQLFLQSTPQRLSGRRGNSCVRGDDSSSPPSRKPLVFSRRIFGADVTNLTPSTTQKKSVPLYKSTGLTPMGADSAKRAPRPTTTSVATSPLPLDDRTQPPEGYVLISEEELRRKDSEIRRLDRALSFVRQEARKAEKEAEDERNKCQEKIQTIVGISARLEESKRYIRQLKKETADVKQRTLPLFNEQLKMAKGTGATPDELEKLEDRVKLKYAKLLRAQEDEYTKVFEEQQEKIEALEDALAATRNVEANARQSLLVSAFSRNNHLARQLTELEVRQEETLKRLAEAIQQTDNARQEVKEARRDALKSHSSSSRTAHRDRVTIDELQAHILNLQVELEVTTDELEFYKDNFARMQRPDDEEATPVDKAPADPLFPDSPTEKPIEPLMDH